MQASIPDTQQINMVIARMGATNPQTADELAKMLSDPILKTDLDHWSFWTLICLCRHLENQKWVAFVIESRLKGNLSQIGGAGAFGHPEELSQSGEVPGEEDWSYFFHGSGCCLKNRVSGVEIDVDFTPDGRCDEIDPFFYDRYLLSLRQPHLPEKNIRRNEPFESVWHAEIQKLCKAGCLIAQHRIKLTPKGLEIFDAVEPLCARIEKLLESETPDYIQRATYGLLALDDFISVKALRSKLSIGKNIIDSIERRAQSAAQQRLEELADRFRKDKRSQISCLTAIGDLGPQMAGEIVEQELFRTPVDGLANTALRIVCAWNQAGLSAILLRVVKHRHNEMFGVWAQTFGHLARMVKTDDMLPRGSQIVNASIELLKRIPPSSLDARVRQHLLQLLSHVRGANAGEAALVCYLLDMSVGLECLTKALQNSVPIAHEEAAAACLIVGNEEMKNLLIAALENPNLQIQHAVACALVAFESPDARECARRWFARNDGISSPLGKEIEIGGRKLPVYSMDDLSHSNMKMFFNSRLENLQKKFGPLI